MYVRLRGITKLSHLSNSLFVFSQILPLQTATANILLRNLENYALGENVHSRKGGRQVSNRGSCPAAAVWLKLHLVRWAGRDLAQTEARDSRWAGYCCARLLCAFSPQQKPHLSLLNTSVHGPVYAWKILRNLFWERNKCFCALPVLL